MFRAIRNEVCYVRTYVVEAGNAEEAAQLANNRWPYRNLDDEAFKASDFKDIGRAFESDECLLPDH